MKPQNLTIESELFEDFRTKFDAAMNSALRKMKSMSIRAGTVKTTIEIVMEEAEDENGEPVLMPEFSGQVEINLPLKGKIEVKKQSGIIMVKDPISDGFIVASGQYTFMDMLAEQESMLAKQGDKEGD